MKALSLVAALTLFTLSAPFSRAAVTVTVAPPSIVEYGVFGLVPLGNTDYTLASKFEVDTYEHSQFGIWRYGQITVYNHDPVAGAILTGIWIQGPADITGVYGIGGWLDRDQPIKSFPGENAIAFSSSFMAAALPGLAEGISPGGEFGMVDDFGPLFLTQPQAAEGFETGLYRAAIEVQLPNGQLEYFVTGSWKNHGEYVSGVTQVAKQFLAQHIITQKQLSGLISAAAKSDIGK